MNVVIVGCGLIGAKRAKALCKQTLVACCDTQIERAVKVALGSQAEPMTDWQRAVNHKDVDIVIVATTHDALVPVAVGALQAGKHVLVEKPGARSGSELALLEAAAEQSKKLVAVGYNLRYHRAFVKARKLVDSGKLGKLLFVRARYGHGGREGYEKEWRFQPAVSGGGELIDQGAHLIDLARWFLGDFPTIEGHIVKYVWDSPVEDNAFLSLRTADDKTAWLHASATEWKNTFSFEMTGQWGKVEVSGLGGSYGIERLSYYDQRDYGPPPTMIWEYPMADDSWETQFKAFLEDIRLDCAPAVGLGEARKTLEVIDTIYAAERRAAA